MAKPRWTRLISLQAMLIVFAASLVGPIPAQARGPGVTRSTIKIGVHAPTTGGVPLPAASVEKAARVYWQWRKAKNRPIRGRDVEVVLKNDNYNPTQAVAVCKEMVEKDHVFMLSGLLTPSGHDQVQACARYAEKAGVPYVGLGHMRLGVAELNRYFAVTATYKRQGHLLADYITSRFKAGSKVNGVVWSQTPNREEPHDAFVRTIERKGAEIQLDRATGCCPGQTDAQAVVQEMKIAGVENAFVLVTPVFFLQLAKAADNQDYHPRWFAISEIPAGESILDGGCPSGIDGMRILSPAPAFEDRNEFSRNYDRAMERFYGNDRGDQVVWSGWATSKLLGKLLRRPGRHLTRKRFVRRAERAHAVRTKILPPASFSPQNHFGGKGTHVLKADCASKRWVTKARFKQNF